MMSKKTATSQKVIGAFEKVGLPVFGGDIVTAKIDTGTYSGSIHCDHIQVRKNELLFRPLSSRKMIKSRNFKEKFVTSSNGMRQKRYCIQTTITIKGKNYPIVINLADRSKMKWPILIGRKFLGQNKFVVDTELKRRPAAY